ncbi:hypothetical protein ACFVHW_07785 [Streptomyces sp. NPDC127110]|uniref:hypothetical protein n=1 Tax=Streptomyces sp. NPDC127110 TaxID=3345362 RepID=UPI0036256017
MHTHPAEVPDHQGTETTRGEGSSALTWEYGAPDLGLGPVTRPAVPSGSDDAVRDGVEG